MLLRHLLMSLFRLKKGFWRICKQTISPIKYEDQVLNEKLEEISIQNYSIKNL